MKKKNKNHCRLVRKSILDKCRMYSDPALRLIFIRILFKHRVIKNTNPKSFGSRFNIGKEHVRDPDPTDKIRSIGSKWKNSKSGSDRKEPLIRIRQKNAFIRIRRKNLLIRLRQKKIVYSKFLDGENMVFVYIVFVYWLWFYI